MHLRRDAAEQLWTELHRVGWQQVDPSGGLLLGKYGSALVTGRNEAWDSLHLNAVRQPPLFLSLRDFCSEFSFRDLEARADVHAVDVA